MNTALWDPFTEMEKLLEKYGRSDRKPAVSAEDNSLEFGDWAPSVDVRESDKAFNIRVELPGVEKENVGVSIENNLLTIKGEKKTETKDEKRHRTECLYGAFVRSFKLPQSVNAEAVEAEFANGVLNLTAPKTEAAKALQVAVKIK